MHLRLHRESQDHHVCRSPTFAIRRLLLRLYLLQEAPILPVDLTVIDRLTVTHHASRRLLRRLGTHICD